MNESSRDVADRTGQLFIIDGDLNRVRSDAVLIPTDIGYHLTSLWDSLVVPGWESRVDRTQPDWMVNPDPASSRLPQQVWFANVGHISDRIDAYVDVADAYVRSASVSLAERDRGTVRSIPHRLSLNVLGTGAGGMSRQRGLLIRHLVGRLSALVAELGVDVILVTWGFKQYGAARRAQRLLRSMSTLSRVHPVLHDPTIDRAVRELSGENLLQRLVLFVGAGVSRGAGLPDWDELIELLAAEAEPPIDLHRLRAMDSRDQAQVLMQYLGEAHYRQRIVELLTSPKYGLAHGLLASLDAHEVVTTNYDSLIENAYGTARAPAVLPQHPVGQDGRWILKLHGSVDDPSGIVLARQDYLGLPERSAALFGILQAMLMTKHMLFVGYSLTDDTFHRVMHDVRRARGELTRPIGSALTLFEDPLLQTLWGDVLHFVPMAPRPDEVTKDDIDRAARRLEIVLDEIAIRSADISAFLLDPTYDGVLDDGEREIRTAAIALLEATSNDEHIGAAVQGMLSSLIRLDPKDSLNVPRPTRRPNQPMGDGLSRRD